MQHVMIRTSPKGTSFIGNCELCGQSGLTLDDLAKEECPNYAGASPDDAVIIAIEATG